MLAAQKGHIDVCNRLCELGAECKLVDKVSVWIPRLVATRYFFRLLWDVYGSLLSLFRSLLGSILGSFYVLFGVSVGSLSGSP